MKWYLAAFPLAVSFVTTYAQQADPCAGLAGVALGQCQGSQQKLLRQQLDQQQQQIQTQQERQNQLDQQQRQIQQQLESMRQQNESLRKQMDLDKSANQTAQLSATGHAKTPEINSSELKSWKSDNPWYGTDYAKTQFAMRYAKQLQQDRPDLVGRPLFDAISAKVRDTFPAAHH
jgi:septal ring factor EnvC (AmiA/AmiB activator)